ncbi:MAG: hypothetical protein WDO71_02495 [Bacteroidota bacterium]
MEKVEGQVNGGETVEVFTHDKKFVGKGYINPKSQILVRLLTRDKNAEIMNNSFMTRLLNAGNTGKGSVIQKIAGWCLVKLIHCRN